MNKLAIYVHFDPNGNVNDYVITCLQGLFEVVSEIAFVVNGIINPEGRKKLEKLGIAPHVRENVGFDFAAWQFLIKEYGYEKIASYDKLLLTNASYYGPIYPFSEMWAEMDKKECDFWGISKHPNIRHETPEHLQSYWLVFKKNVIQSYFFQEYWNNVPIFTDFLELVFNCEVKLKNQFEGAGFISASFIEHEKYYSLLNENSLVHLPNKYIIEDCCPIIKKKVFSSNEFYVYNHYTLTNKAQKALEYIEKHTQYDTKLIWDDLLSIASPHDIFLHLNLNYTLSTRASHYVQNSKKEKIAFIIYDYYAERLEYYKKCIEVMPSQTDVFFISAKEEVLSAFKKVCINLPNRIEYRIKENRGREQAALLITCKDIVQDYDYICFLHGKKSPQTALQVGEDFAEHCYTNLVHNKIYIENVLQTFKENEHLGLLIPPILHHSIFKWVIGHEWAHHLNKERANNFIKEKKLDLQIDDIPLAPMGGMFWLRPEALKSLFACNWQYEDFPEEPIDSDGTIAHALERMFPYFAKNSGYMTAWIMSDVYSQVYVKNLYYSYRSLYMQSQQTTTHQIGCPPSVQDVTSHPQTIFIDKHKIARRLFVTKIKFALHSILLPFTSKANLEKRMHKLEVYTLAMRKYRQQL